VTVRESALAPVRLADRTGEIRLLVQAREDAIAEAVRVRNSLHADLVMLVPGYGATSPNLLAARHRRRAGCCCGAAAASRLTWPGLGSLGCSSDREARQLEAWISAHVGAHPLLEMHASGS
jgi:hypothetical protein